MTRTALLAASLLAGTVLVAPIAADAQSGGKVFRVGYIRTATPEEQAHLTRAFEEGMRELGYVEGRIVVYERKFAHGDPKRLPALAAELVRRNPDVIVTGSNPVIAAVMQASSTIPIVMTTSRDPVGSKFIASLNRPGGNVTGLTADAVVVHRDPVFFTARTQVVELVTKHRLPAMLHARKLVELGGLIAYGSSLTDQFRRVSVYVDRVLKGDKPGELAVRQPERYELVINGATAQALGLPIPPSLRIQAEVVG